MVSIILGIGWLLLGAWLLHRRMVREWDSKELRRVRESAVHVPPLFVAVVIAISLPMVPILAVGRLFRGKSI